MLRTADDSSTARLDHLAELATSPTQAAHPSHPYPHSHSHHPSHRSHHQSHPSSPLYQDRHPMDDLRGGPPVAGGHQGHPHSQGPDRYSGPPPHSQQHPHYQQQQHHQQQHQQQHSHHHSSYGRGESRSHPGPHQQPYQQQQDQDVNAPWRSPITPTTTRKFNRMAIHEVLDSHQQQQQQQHPYGNEGREDSPPFKRKGSPEEFAYSDPPPGSSSGAPYPGGHHPPRSYSRPDQHQRPLSPRYRQESPMPGSNSEDDDDDLRNSKKRRMAQMQGQRGGPQQHSPPSSSPGGPPEVLDQVRSTLKLKQQQKAIIESRQGSQPQPPSQQHGGIKPNSSNGGNQPITETTPSGLSVFHGSASFASLNRRPQPSPKNPKNAKSLTIFAPSYSESSLSIQSAPLQPSQSHQAMSMNPRTSQPLLQRQHPHPYAQHSGAFQQPLRSPRTAGHSKKPSRVTIRQSDHSSGTLPAPILSSHTGPLPSPSMYPPTPFHSNPKQHFLETVSTLFDSVDSSRNLKFTLEEQIRKSAQLLQTLQSSGTMIENLVRGQFKELERGVIDRFEGEIEHLNARVRQLEEHQGLTPPPRKSKASVPAAGPSSSSTTTPTPPSSLSAMTGVTLTSGPNSGSSAGSATAADLNNSNNNQRDSPPASQHGTPNSGTLPTPPLTKAQDSAMEIEEEESEDGPERAEYRSSVQKLQERIETLEAKKD